MMPLRLCVFWMLAPLRSVAIALRELRAQKLKCLLTIIGIMIATASVTAAAAALTGLRTKVLRDIDIMGATKMNISGKRPSSGPKRLWPGPLLGLKSWEFDSFRVHCPSIETFTRQAGWLAPISNGQWEIAEGDLLGVDETWHEITGRSVIAGRQLSYMDVREAKLVCLIPEEVRVDLHLPVDCVGRPLLIAGKMYKIIGIVEPPSAFEIIEAQSDDPRNTIVPFTTIYNGTTVWLSNVTAKARSPQAVNNAVAETLAYFRRIRRLSADEPDTFAVTTAENYLSTYDEISRDIITATILIVSVSLLVGGIGVMNIMLISVAGRKHEIGLRKAVGATPLIILIQFLAEAAILSLSGGLLGLALGQLLTTIMRTLPGTHLDQAEVQPWVAALSCAVAICTGIVFGMLPAIKAASLEPVRALRCN